MTLIASNSTKTTMIALCLAAGTAACSPLGQQRMTPIVIDLPTAQKTAEGKPVTKPCYLTAAGNADVTLGNDSDYSINYNDLPEEVKNAGCWVGVNSSSHPVSGMQVGADLAQRTVETGINAYMFWPRGSSGSGTSSGASRTGDKFINKFYGDVTNSGVTTNQTGGQKWNFNLVPQNPEERPGLKILDKYASSSRPAYKVKVTGQANPAIG